MKIWSARAAAAAPVITYQPPTDWSPSTGTTLFIRAEARTKGTLVCQWFHDGLRIPGAVSPELVLNEVTPGCTGYYHLEVTDLADGISVASRQVRVRVQTLRPVPPGAADDPEALEDAIAYYNRPRSDEGDIGPAGPEHYVPYLLARGIAFRSADQTRHGAAGSAPAAPEAQSVPPVAGGQASFKAVAASVSAPLLPTGPAKAAQPGSWRARAEQDPYAGRAPRMPWDAKDWPR